MKMYRDIRAVLESRLGCEIERARIEQHLRDEVAEIVLRLPKAGEAEDVCRPTSRVVV